MLSIVPILCWVLYIHSTDAHVLYCMTWGMWLRCACGTFMRKSFSNIWTQTHTQTRHTRDDRWGENTRKLWSTKCWSSLSVSSIFGVRRSSLLMFLVVFVWPLFVALFAFVCIIWCYIILYVVSVNARMTRSMVKALQKTTACLTHMLHIWMAIMRRF